jgi:Putative zinc-finger
MDYDTIQMTCAQVEDELSAYLDDELDLPTRRKVDAHLATCVRCPALLADFRQDDVLLRAMPFIEPPPGMAERFFASPGYLKAVHAPERSRKLILGLTGGLVAAAMLVLALGGTLLIRQGFFGPQQAVGPNQTTTIGNSGTSAPFPAGPRLVYERSGALWSAPESGGGSARQLTPAGAQVAGWSVSPSGRTVLYINARTGALHTIRADSLNDTAIGTVTGGQAPSAGFWSSSTGMAIARGIAWSPDNTRVAYVALSASGTLLHVMSANGAADRAVGDGHAGQSGHPLWSADSVYIAYTMTQGTQTVEVYNVTTSRLRVVAARADAGNPAAVVGQLAWLPGQSPATITWSTRAGGAITAIYRASVTGDSAVQLTPQGISYTAADVSASGAWLLAYGATLAEIAPHGSSPQAIVTLAHAVTQVYWAPSGKMAAVVAGDALAVLAPDHSVITIAREIPAQAAIAWSPQSNALAWQSAGGVMSAPVSASGVAGAAKQVAQSATANALSWAADGKSLAVRSAAGVMLVSADGALARSMRDGAAAVSSALAWSLAG